MRNCITKFSVFYPTLRINLQHADYGHTEEVLRKDAEKKYDEVRRDSIEPWNLEEARKTYAPLKLEERVFKD